MVTATALWNTECDLAGQQGSISARNVPKRHVLTFYSNHTDETRYRAAREPGTRNAPVSGFSLFSVGGNEKTQEFARIRVNSEDYHLNDINGEGTNRDQCG